ncbi:MAG: DciA family protein [Burkholderiales bacterium]
MHPLIEKAREIRDISRLFGEFLPPELARNAQVANIKDGNLVILAANSATAAKLRLLAESLTVFLAKQRVKVSGVSVRVQPNASRGRATARRQNVQFSAGSLAELAALHARLSDSPARAALGALLEHHGIPLPAKPSPEGAQRGTQAESRRPRKVST